MKRACGSPKNHGSERSGSRQTSPSAPDRGDRRLAELETRVEALEKVAEWFMSNCHEYKEASNFYTVLCEYQTACDRDKKRAAARKQRKR